MRQSPSVQRPAPETPSAHDSERSPSRAPYVKPRLEPGGSVFRQTGALGSGSKDPIIGGSAIL